VVTDTDRDKYCVNRIVDFYKRQPTDLADYFQAAWQLEMRVLWQRRLEPGSVAALNKVSPNIWPRWGSAG